MICVQYTAEPGEMMKESVNFLYLSSSFYSDFFFLYRRYFDFFGDGFGDNFYKFIIR